MKFFALAIGAIALICTGCSYLSPTSEQPSDPTITGAVETQATEDSSAEVSIDESGIELESLLPDTRYYIHGPRTPEASESQNTAALITSDLCKEIGAKLGSVDEADCLRQDLKTTDGKSVQGRDLAIKSYPPTNSREPLGRVLVIGGIHGDEFSSVSVVFKWMDILNKHHSGLFDWRFIPASNPDGLLREKSQRQNANGVDLNRNFPTADWQSLAQEHWADKAMKHPRRYPGESANSEPETQWLVNQINEFKPDVIVSMHAPYHLVDYDGPPSAPDQLGSLYLRRLGVFPGSLGNYAGVDLKIPIVTVELASAGSMPSPTEISDMWDDLVSWLRSKLNAPTPASSN